MMARRQRGALLLVVALLLASIAALAYGLTGATGAETRSVMDDYEGRAAAYLAEGAVAAARWRSQVAGCPQSKVEVKTPSTPLGNGMFEAVAVGDAGRLNVVATGTLPRAGQHANAQRSIERTKLLVYNFTDLESDDDDFDDALDTTIAVLRTAPDSNNEKLSLVAGQSHALLYWSVDDLDKEDKLISATLTLTLTARSTSARTVALHRMTTKWDANATWVHSRLNTPWTGSDYSNAPQLATVAANALSVTWDVTSLVESWSRGPASNAGILLRLADTGAALDFHGRKAGSSNLRPAMRVVVAEKC